jgi:hypothetical protein
MFLSQSSDNGSDNGSDGEPVSSGWIAITVLIFIVAIVSICSIYFVGMAWILNKTEQFIDFGYSAALWDGFITSDRVNHLLPIPIILFLIFYTYVFRGIDTRLILIVFLLVVWVVIRRKNRR